MPLLQKGTVLNPTVVSPAQCLAAATTAGAKAMGYNDLGLLREGYLADLALLTLHAPNMVPIHDLENNLIYAAQGSDVKLTMVDGKVMYQDGRYTTMNKDAILAKAQNEATLLTQRAAQKAAK